MLQPNSLIHPRAELVDPSSNPNPPTTIVVDNVDRTEVFRRSESTGVPAARVGEGAVFGVSVLQDTTIPSSIVVVSAHATDRAATFAVCSSVVCAFPWFSAVTTVVG